MSSNDYLFSTRTHRGRVRLANEDAYAISTADCIEGRCAGTIPRGGWALLADGMGGHAGGRIASQLAIECLRSLAHRFHAEGEIEDVVAAANDALFTAMKDDEVLAGMGTTIAGVVLSEQSAALMRLTLGIFGDAIDRPIDTWHSRQGPIDIGGFQVTPFLTDHSALDAYMLLIEKDGMRMFYTGDFRTHGRKSVLVERMMSDPPAGVDVLLMEGTNLRSDKPVVTEVDLEARFIALARDVPGHIFVDWSAQNFDRTVTLLRAARRTGRDLVLDMYAADALLQVADGTRLPCPGHPDFPELKVVITPSMKRLYSRIGRSGFVDELVAKGCATSRRKVAEKPAILMARNSLVRDFEAGGDLPMTASDCFVHSSWSGYLDESNVNSGWIVAGRAGARRELIHTSGHASAPELSRFAAAIDPQILVPVHGVEWDAPGIALPPVKRLRDGERWAIGSA